MSCQLNSIKIAVLGALWKNTFSKDESSVQWSLQKHRRSSARHIYISLSAFLCIGASKSRPCKTLTYLLASACRQQKRQCSDRPCGYTPLVRMRIKYDLSRKWRLHLTNTGRAPKAVGEYVWDEMACARTLSPCIFYSLTYTLVVQVASWLNGLQAEQNSDMCVSPSHIFFVLKRLEGFVKKPFKKIVVASGSVAGKSGNCDKLCSCAVFGTISVVHFFPQ